MSERRKNKTRGVYERTTGSNNWYIRFSHEGKIHRRRIGRKSEAIAALNQVKAEIAAKGRVSSHQTRPKLRSVIDTYLSSIKHTHRSIRDYERYGRNWVARLGDRRLDQVLPSDIEQVRSERLNTVEPATINRELAFLKRVYNVAINDGLCDQNPVSKVKFQRENNARVRYLSEEEESRLKAELGDEHWPKIDLAIHTGLRQAEQFGLRWSDIDFQQRVITVRQSKSGRARRVVMNETAVRILRDLPSRQRSEFVFPSRGGTTSMDAHNFANRVFRPALGRARIDDFRWHDLRHTFASRLVILGASLRAVQEEMGHATILMTMRYSHLSVEQRLKTVRLLDAGPTDTQTDTGASSAAGVAAAGGKVIDLAGKNGGPCRDRTYDPLIKSQLLYQLS